MVTNKNLRPYCISIDWLQLHLHRPADFLPSAPAVKSLFATREDRLRWRFSELGHGSKTYKDIYLVKHRGEEWAELSINPYSQSIHPLSATLKIKNKILYAPRLMTDLAEFCEFLGFKFLGISRLDLAYDCNEFYGGLSPEHLMAKYERGDIIKFGSGGGYRQFVQGYSLGFDSTTGKKTLTADVPLWQPRSEDEKPPKAYLQEVERQQIYQDPNCLIELPEHRNPLLGGRSITPMSKPIIYTSTTWGSRSSGHQVQLYNKTLEMQQVAYKHHIAQRWQSYGLDLKRDVWRLEIRITKNARLLENAQTGTRHLLDPRDLIEQEQIEQIFWDYAYKFFRFYTLDPRDRRTSDGKKQRSLMAMLQHKDRLKVYRILSCASRNSAGELTEPLTHTFIPRVPTPQHDYTRGIKQALNVVEGAIKSCADASDPNIIHLQETARHLSAVYGVEKRELFAEREFRARALASESDYPIFRYYQDNWGDVPSHWFTRAQSRQAKLAWDGLKAGASLKAQEEVRNLGYNVHPAFAEPFLEHLLDTGEPLEHYVIDGWREELPPMEAEISENHIAREYEAELLRLQNRKHRITDAIQIASKRERASELQELFKELQEIIEDISAIRELTQIQNLSS